MIFQGNLGVHMLTYGTISISVCGIQHLLHSEVLSVWEGRREITLRTEPSSIAHGRGGGCLA